MKKNVTYIAAAQFETLIAESGLTTSEKSGWIRVDGQNGHRLYVPKTKKVGRIDCVGLDIEGLTALGGESFGAVTHQVDFNRPEEFILAVFSLALDALKSLPAVEKAPKAKAEPKARRAAGTEPAAAAPTASRSDRMALIKRVAAERGVPVSADVESELATEIEPVIEQEAEAESDAIMEALAEASLDGSHHNATDSQ